jgi:hypothetical protein
MIYALIAAFEGECQFVNSLQERGTCTNTIEWTCSALGPEQFEAEKSAIRSRILLSEKFTRSCRAALPSTKTSSAKRYKVQMSESHEGSSRGKKQGFPKRFQGKT